MQSIARQLRYLWLPGWSELLAATVPEPSCRDGIAGARAPCSVSLQASARATLLMYARHRHPVTVSLELVSHLACT